MDALNVATIIIALISFAGTLMSNTMSWSKRLEGIEDELNLHMQEINVLIGIVQESEEIIHHAGDELPNSIQIARRLCQKHEEILARSFSENDLNHDIKKESLAKLRLRKVKATLNADEWKKAFGLYRGSVFMLRDLCADIKMHMQLRNMTAAMARLDEEFAGAPSAKDLVELQGDDFFVIAYIRAAHLQDYGNPEQRALPATLKLDTGADVDHVSQQFLNDVLNLNEDSFLPIPDEQQEPITGFDGTQYTPKFRIELEWSRQLNREMKKHVFLVVPNCPCDIVLGARNFLQQATGLTKRIQVAARGSKNLTESEQQKQLQAIVAEREKERLKFEEAKAKRAKRSWTGRLSTNANEDVEMQNGSSLIASAQSPTNPTN